MSRFSESVVKDAAPDCLDGLGYAVLHGPDLAAGELGAERSDWNFGDHLPMRRETRRSAS